MYRGGYLSSISCNSSSSDLINEDFLFSHSVQALTQIHAHEGAGKKHFTISPLKYFTFHCFTNKTTQNLSVLREKKNQFLTEVAIYMAAGAFSLG